MAEATTVPVKSGNEQLARREPLDTFERFREEMERFFGEARPWSGIRLPEQIAAEYKDGVLEVRIPKPAEVKPEPKKITVG